MFVENQVNKYLMVVCAFLSAFAYAILKIVKGITGRSSFYRIFAMSSASLDAH